MNEFKVHYDEAEDILHLGREGQENEGRRTFPRGEHRTGRQREAHRHRAFQGIAVVSECPWVDGKENQSGRMISRPRKTLNLKT